MRAPATTMAPLRDERPRDGEADPFPHACHDADFASEFEIHRKPCRTWRTLDLVGSGSTQRMSAAGEGHLYADFEVGVAGCLAG